MDRIDSAIVTFLKKDSRMSFRKIAKELKVSPDTITNRVNLLEQKEVIRGSTVVINPEKIGYECMAMIMLDAESKSLTLILNKLIKIPSIILATKTIGDHDLLAIGVAKNVRHLNELVRHIADIPDVNDLEVSFWIGPMKICPEYFLI